MAEIIVGAGELAASNRNGTVLRVCGLGSNVVVIALDARTRTIGMVQIVLPDSKVDPVKGDQLPGCFADSGIRELVNLMKDKGVNDIQSIIVKLAGGAQIMDSNSIFSIGSRNIVAVKQQLAEYGLVPMAEDLGNSYSRTVTTYIDSGVVELSSPGRQDWYL